MRLTRQTLHRILAGRSSVTAEMALRLGRFTGTTPALWLNLQAQHDLWHQQRAPPLGHLARPGLSGQKRESGRERTSPHG